MSRRLAKVNKHLQRVFGQVLQEEGDLPPDMLVTISRVETAANLRSAVIWLYVSPLVRQAAGQEQKKIKEVLEALTNQLYHLQGALNRKLTIRPLPRIRLKLDLGAQHAEDIQRKLNSLHS